MTAKSDELIAELVSACVAFGREKEPNWQTRIETARVALKAHIEELEAKVEAQESEATSCKFCGSNKSDIRMNSIVCTSCGRKIGNIAPPEVQE